jgi:hypothetical protein
VIGVVPARFDESFGYQSLACWAMAASIVVAVFATDTRMSVAAVVIADAPLVGWYVWAAWLVTTPAFSQQSYPFVAQDLIGSGWYLGGVAVIVAGASVAVRVHNKDEPAGAELWALSAIPGAGLFRLGKRVRGSVWAVLVGMALFFAGQDTSDPAMFNAAGRWLEIPTAPPTRAPALALLAAAVFFLALSVGDTILQRRRLLD